MKRKDFVIILIIGVAIGLLIQPIITNLIGDIQKIIPVSPFLVRSYLFLFFVALAPAALFIAYLISRFLSVIYQVAKYAAVGSLNSFVNLGVFNLETLMLGYIPSGRVFALLKTISFAVATTNSYIWNKYWTFESRSKPSSSEVSKFFSVQIIGAGIDVGVATLVFKIGLGSGLTSPELWTNLVAPVAGFLMAFVWNFLGNKYFVFKEQQNMAAQPLDHSAI